MLLTIDDYCRLPHIEEPTELVRGVLVRRQFTYVPHGLVCATICHLLGTWDHKHGRGSAIALHGVITHRNPDSLRSIDVGYYHESRLPREDIGDEYSDIVPDVAFEVRSHDETWFDIAFKMSEFVGAGTRVFVACDPFAKTLHVFEPERPTRILRGDQVLSLDAVLPGFCHRADEFFE